MKRALSWLPLLALFAGCGGEEFAPNIVVITLDTFRADRLGCYGNPGSLSPNIDQFASFATRFTRAKASSPWTLPSHASLLTGLHPFEHGAHSYRVEVKPWSAGGDPKTAVDNVLPLHERFDTLAERLGRGGYETAAVVANQVYLDPKYGCDQGFDSYEVVPDVGRMVVDHALRWLDGRAEPERPFFLFLNFMDTHSPYNTAPREGWEDLGAPVESARLLNQLNDIVLSGASADPAQLALLARQYDLSVANLDEQLGRLMEQFRERGIYNDLLVVLTSDHGEYLGEHRLIGHSKDVYEEAIAIPLIIKSPRQREGRIEERPVGLVHVTSLLALDCSPLRGVEPARPWPESLVIAENHFSRIKDLRRPWGVRFARSRVAAYRDEYKLIHSTDRRHELYDLRRDPYERQSLATSQNTVREGLDLELRGFLQPNFTKIEDIPELGSDISPSGLTEEEIERLRSLGYF